MILSAALLLLAQDVPATRAVAPPAEDEANIVVRATFGRTTMLFDKGADGKLRNCRVMISSGSQRRDTTACEATPVCYARTADEVTDCRELSILEQAAAIGAPRTPAAPGVSKPGVFELPKLVQPKPVLSADLVGPIGNGEDSRETERQRVKPIAPPTNPASDGPVVRFTTGNQPQHNDTDKSEKRP
ncbi:MULTISPECIES: hypothetical protein [unclassified Sphingomonas]|uniref:hypothetical protein n=1 Tax=Sphingomonas TaxID=13687 RepID=UPI00095F4EC5|nr:MULTISPECIES: hypothetical protein [unclassified Sphingomonas]MBN8812234.1 hypothetical protein [Sphingomonas sp.]OJY47940.1 MAG: hypothetical protein BGP17_01955 [Sphingomonas sp. 67-41]